MQLINDDCLNAMSKLPDNSIDLIITSPPYDNIRDYNNSSIWNFDIFKNIANDTLLVFKFTKPPLETVKSRCQP